MRRLTAAIAGVAVLALSLTMCGAEGLVTNSDFSQVSGGDQGLPAGWTVAGTDSAAYRVVNDDGHSGSLSLRYEVERATASGAVVQSFVCKPNTDYLVTAALKSDGRLLPVVQVVVPVNPPVKVLALRSGGQKVWTVQTARFNSGTATRLEVRVYGDAALAEGKQAAAGVSGVDDVQVYEASKAPAEASPAPAMTPPGPNIALKRPYTLTPAPNYSYCTEPGDKTQLTDGVYSVGYFWTQPTTVGWSGGSPARIRIDLGKIEPIAGLSFSTAAGVAGVAWPTAILVLVSDDGDKWTWVGDLVEKSLRFGMPPTDRYSQHRFFTDDLEARGRYVELVVDASPYCFVDEVEVYRGTADLLLKAPVGKVADSPTALFEQLRLRSAVLWRLTTDLEEARKSIRESRMTAAEKERLLDRADRLAEEIRRLPSELPADMHCVLPLNDLHAEIYALNTPVLRAQGLSGLTVWAAKRWDPLLPTQGPELPLSSPVLQLAMMRNETRAVALNLTNCTDGVLEAGVTVTGFGGPVNPEWISVREVVFTDTRDRRPIAAALPQARKADDEYETTVLSGVTRQVWLSINTKGIAAGEYRGQVVISGAGKRTEVPLSIRVYPQQMPSQFTAAVGGWDYTNGSGSYDVKPSNLQLLIDNLRAHGVNSPWASSGVMPQGATFDAAGNLTGTLDFSAWDTWVSRWPGAKNYCVFLAVGDKFSGEPMGTARFNKMVGELFRAWVKHFDEQGLNPAKLVVLLVDEPHNNDQVKVIVNWAKAVKAAAPEVVLFEDPTFRDPREADPELFAVSDILCPNLPMWWGAPKTFADFYWAQREATKKLWFYSCSGPAKLLDPINYHRAQFWAGMAHGAQGSFYWAFGDESNAAGSWRAYSHSRNQYSPLFIDATSVTDGKHMEAIREGAEDYEYFVMLRDRWAQLRQEGVTSPELQAAEGLLAAGPHRALKGVGAGSLGWLDSRDREEMDRVRVEFLEALQRL
jgi:hypothetical protein